MKLCFLVLVLAVGSQGFLLADLKDTFHKVGDAFTATFHTVGEQAKQVGNSLLGTLKEQGTSLLGQTVQSKNSLKSTNQLVLPYIYFHIIDLKSHY